MSILKNLFNGGVKSAFKLRYSKTDDQWQVYKEKTLVYVGSKEACTNYMTNFEPAV